MKQNCCVPIPAYQPPEKFLEYTAVLRAAGIRNILVVDDGSGEQYSSVLDRLRRLEGCEVIGYPVNRGKGGAMKYGFAHIRSTRPQCQVVVTVDCDGQHTAQDVLRVAQDAAEHHGQLVLGVRDFTKTANGTPVPLRSLLPGENFARIAAATVGAQLVSMLVNYTLENLLSQYDCLVVVEPDRAEQRMLQKHFGVDGSAGFYRIEKSGTLLRLKAE